MRRAHKTKTHGGDKIWVMSAGHADSMKWEAGRTKQKPIVEMQMYAIEKEKNKTKLTKIIFIHVKDEAEIINSI